MEIWHITEGESFVAGTDDSKTIRNRFIKLRSASIFFCQQGFARIKIDLEEYDLVTNTQVVLLPGTIIYVTDVSDDFLISFIDFSDTLFLEMTARLDTSFFRFLKENPCVLLPEEHTKNVCRLAEWMIDLYNDRDNCFRIQIARNFIQGFLLDIYDKTKRLFMRMRPEGVSRQEELFKRFIQLIHKHCIVEREVAFYAGELCITPRYLSTIVRSVSGLTAKNIIDKLVLLEIKVLLKSTNMSIQEISHRLSFPNQSFFGRYFKKHTGISPFEYRSTLAD